MYYWLVHQQQLLYPAATTASTILYYSCGRYELVCAVQMAVVLCIASYYRHWRSYGHVVGWLLMLVKSLS
jgi:hypothetical protein